MSSIRNGPSTIFYETYGDTGDPVALIHGSLVDKRSWGAILAPLGTNLQVLAYDRRGYGESTGPSRIHSVRDDAQDLAELLEATGLYPAHLVAHSYAGAVALRLAADRPELVRSMALHEPPLIGLLAQEADGAAEVQRWKHRIDDLRRDVRSGEKERATREVVNTFSSREGAWNRLPLEARQQALRYIGLWAEEFADPEAVEPDPAALKEVCIPVLLTMGENSPSLVRRMAEILAARLSNGTLQSIPGAGHTPHVTSPDRYLGILTTFLLERNVPTV